MTSSQSDVISSIETGEGTDSNHPGYGWVMFYVFGAAVLAISFAVGALALVPTWWMLGVVFAVHLAVTGAVMFVVNRAFELNSGADEDAPAPALAAPALSAVPVLGAAA